MNILNLQNSKVSKGTVKSITEFVYTNRADLSNEMKMFYCDVKCLIERQLTKPSANRMTMPQILERSYNIELYILNAGAASVETEFIHVKH